MGLRRQQSVDPPGLCVDVITEIKGFSFRHSGFTLDDGHAIVLVNQRRRLLADEVPVRLQRGERISSWLEHDLDVAYGSYSQHVSWNFVLRVRGHGHWRSRLAELLYGPWPGVLTLEAGLPIEAWVEEANEVGLLEALAISDIVIKLSRMEGHVDGPPGRLTRGADFHFGQETHGYGRQAHFRAHESQGQRFQIWEKVEEEFLPNDQVEALELKLRADHVDREIIHVPPIGVGNLHGVEGGQRDRGHVREGRVRVTIHV